MTYSSGELTGSTIRATFNGSSAPASFFFYSEPGIFINLPGNFIMLHDLDRSMCFHNPEQCSQGFTLTISVFVRVDEPDIE